MVTAIALNPVLMATIAPPFVGTQALVGLAAGVLAGLAWLVLRAAKEELGSSRTSDPVNEEPALSDAA